MRKILKVFAENHILANFTVVLVIAFAFYLWGDIPKQAEHRKKSNIF